MTSSSTAMTVELLCTSQARSDSGGEAILAPANRWATTDTATVDTAITVKTATAAVYGVDKGGL